MFCLTELQLPGRWGGLNPGLHTQTRLCLYKSNNLLALSVKSSKARFHNDLVAAQLWVGMVQHSSTLNRLVCKRCQLILLAKQNKQVILHSHHLSNACFYEKAVQATNQQPFSLKLCNNYKGAVLPLTFRCELRVWLTNRKRLNTTYWEQHFNWDSQEATIVAKTIIHL